MSSLVFSARIPTQQPVNANIELAQHGRSSWCPQDATSSSQAGSSHSRSAKCFACIRCCVSRSLAASWCCMISLFHRKPRLSQYLKLAACCAKARRLSGRYLPHGPVSCISSAVFSLPGTPKAFKFNANLAHRPRVHMAVWGAWAAHDPGAQAQCSACQQLHG